MTEERFHKSEIARRQLETAVYLFVRGLDRSSVITLAGAASGILDQLVKNAGKEPFVDYARRVHNHMHGFTPPRKKFAHHIAKRTGVIAHKHMSKSDGDTVDLDLDEMAVKALGRAMADYAKLYGSTEPFVKAFFSWAWENMDGPKLMEQFGQVPEKAKPK